MFGSPPLLSRLLRTLTQATRVLAVVSRELKCSSLGTELLVYNTRKRLEQNLSVTFPYRDMQCPSLCVDCNFDFRVSVLDNFSDMGWGAAGRL